MSSSKERSLSGVRGCGGAVGVVALALFGTAVWLWGGFGSVAYRAQIPPVPAAPNPNAFDDVLSICTAFEANGADAVVTNYGKSPNLHYVDPRKLTPDMQRAYWRGYAAKERQVVKANGALFPQIHAACASPMAVHEPRSLLALLPYLSRVRRLVRLEGYRMDLLHGRGDDAAAMEAGLDAMRLANGLARHGSALHAVVACSARHMVIGRLAWSAERLSPSEADRLGKELEQVGDEAPGIREGLVEERAIYMSDLPRQMRQNPTQVYHFPRPAWLGWLPAPIVEARDRRLTAERGLATLRGLDDYYREFIAVCEEPAGRRKRLATPRDADLQFEPADFDATMGSVDLDLAHRRLLRCQLAIRAFRGRMGRFPASLAELGLPAHWTTDPYTGNGFVYRALRRDYRLYSVGPDLRDDGGKPWVQDGQPYDVGLCPSADSQFASYTHMSGRLLHMGEPAAPTARRKQ